MFSKLGFLLISILAFSKSVTASDTGILESGHYTLVEGDQNLCQNFKVTEKDLNRRSISIGNLYRYDTKNSVHVIESDIDPQCEFREINQRFSDEDQTTLTKINEEFCKGKLRSKTLSSMSIEGQKITIIHKIHKAPSYKCIWAKE